MITDPPEDAIGTLIPTAERENRWIELPADSPSLPRNDWEPCDGKPGTWRARTSDPWLICPVDVKLRAEFRFFVLRMSCSSAGQKPFAQLFWSGPHQRD